VKKKIIRYSIHGEILLGVKKNKLKRSKDTYLFLFAPTLLSSSPSVLRKVSPFSSLILLAGGEPAENAAGVQLKKKFKNLFLNSFFKINFIFYIPSAGFEAPVGEFPRLG
jgi:hypothetical protein